MRWTVSKRLQVTSSMHQKVVHGPVSFNDANAKCHRDGSFCTYSKEQFRLFKLAHQSAQTTIHILSTQQNREKSHNSHFCKFLVS